MDKLERARKMFRELEARGVPHSAEIARRIFLIDANLNVIRG